MRRSNLPVGAIVCIAASVGVALLTTNYFPQKQRADPTTEIEVAHLIRDLQRDFPDGAKFIDDLAREVAGASAVREYREIEEKLRSDLSALKVEKSQLERILNTERAAVAEIIRANNQAFEEAHKWDDEKSFLINVASGIFGSGIALLWGWFRSRKKMPYSRIPPLNLP